MATTRAWRARTRTAATSPNVNRFFDHIENTFDRNGDLVYGRLGTDRPHQFKAQFAYQFPTKTTLGLNQRIASGIPISGRSQRARRASRSSPTAAATSVARRSFNQTDLSVFQDIRFGGNEVPGRHDGPEPVRS